MTNKFFRFLNMVLLLFGLVATTSAATPSKQPHCGNAIQSGQTTTTSAYAQNPRNSSALFQNNPLSGNYTIGPVGAGSFDFNTIADAVSALQNNGVSAHTFFLISPGTYTGQITIDSIPGSGSNATITFRSSTSDSTSVTVDYASLSSTDNWVIRINGGSHITFSHMTIRASGVSYGKVLELTGNSGHISVSNCRLETDSISSSNAFACIYQSNSSGFQHFSLTHCALAGGYYSVFWNMSSGATRGNGFIASDNTLRGYYLHGFYIHSTDSIRILANNLRNRQVLTGIQAVYIISTSGYGEISSNVIETWGPGGQQGIYIQDKAATPALPLLISNNMIIQNGSTIWSMYGIYLIGSEYVDVYYNSVRVNSSSATNGRAFMQTTSGNIKVINNIFTNYNGGYAYYVNTPTGILESNNNCLYTTGANLAYWGGTNRTTLAALMAASQKDSASLNQPPPFVSSSDLHLTSTALSGYGKSLAAVQTDIHGTQRTPFPTIGAHEVPLIQYDALVTEIISPGLQTLAGMLYPVEVRIKNDGYDTIHSVVIQYRVNGGQIQSGTYNATLLPKQSSTVQLPDMVSPSGPYILSVWTVLAGDTNFHNDTLHRSIFGKSQLDMSALKVFGPVEGCRQGPDTIHLLIKNTGIQTVNAPGSPALILGYRIIGLPAIFSGTLTQPIPPGDSILYTFPSPYSFINHFSDSTYTLSAWVSLAGDIITSNDTAHIDIFVSRTPLPPVVAPVTIPYSTQVTLTAQSQDSIQWYTSVTATVPVATGTAFTTPVLIQDTVFWAESRSPELQPVANIAPDAAASHSSGGTSGFGAQNYNDGNISPDPNLSWGWVSTNGWIEFTWPQEMTFSAVKFFKGNRPMTSCTLQYYANGGYVDFYNYYGTSLTDSVVFLSIATSKLRIFSISGAVNPNFREIQVFEPKRSGCQGPRVPVQVSVLNPTLCDVGVTRILSPSSGVFLSHAEEITIRVRNTGTSGQSGIPVNLQIDSLPVITEIISTIIPAGNETDYTFSAKIDLSDTGNTYLIRAWTSLSCDTVPQNDTIRSEATHIPSTYCISTAQVNYYGEITHVSIGSLNNTTPGYGAMYSDFTDTVPPPILTPGIPYTTNILTGVSFYGNPGINYRMKGWIDFNRDGILDPQGEMVFSGAATNLDTLYMPVSIPVSASPGPTLMRITMQQTTVDSTVTPCNTYNTGETEDYLVIIAKKAGIDAAVIETIHATATQNPTTPLWLKFMNCGTEPINP
ncbi:MAG: GEVED domain-containing protein, partial [Bacteroidales bacterium]